MNPTTNQPHINKRYSQNPLHARIEQRGERVNTHHENLPVLTAVDVADDVALVDSLDDALVDTLVVGLLVIVDDTLLVTLVVGLLVIVDDTVEVALVESLVLPLDVPDVLTEVVTDVV
jgi:hypothetical protein